MFLSCRSVSAQLTDGEHVHGGALCQMGIRLHLALCENCTRYLAQLRAVQAALAALRTGEVTPETKVRLSVRFQSWQAGLGKPSA